MPKFRKRPMVIEAEQFHLGEIGQETVWPAGVCCSGMCEFTHGNGPHVHTLEGPLRVTDKDWIITGINGERYPCKPDVFVRTYEQVDD